MELSLNWNPSVLVEKSRAFALKRSFCKLERITGYFKCIQLYRIKIAEPETYLKSIKMTDIWYTLFTLCMAEPLDSVFH